MALTANREVSRYVDQELRTFPVVGASRIYKGALVGIHRATGCVRALVAGDMFAGVAYEEVDNTSGENGDRMIRLYTQGDFVLEAACATPDLIGAPVYADSDESVTLLGSRSTSYCGFLMAALGTGKAIIRICPLAKAQTELSVQVPITSSTTGATSNPVMITLRSVHIVSVSVFFTSPPDQGVLNIGTGSITPNEIVNNFNLAALSPSTLASPPVNIRSQAAGQRIWAKVSQAASSAGEGGVLVVRYVELA